MDAQNHFVDAKLLNYTCPSSSIHPSLIRERLFPTRPNSKQYLIANLNVPRARVHARSDHFQRLRNRILMVYDLASASVACAACVNWSRVAFIDVYRSLSADKETWKPFAQHTGLHVAFIRDSLEKKRTKVYYEFRNSSQS